MSALYAYPHASPDVAPVTVSWAPRPDPDAPMIPPPCVCPPETKERAAKRNITGHWAHWYGCPLSEPEHKRVAAHRAAAITWDQAAKARTRAQAALTRLSTPAGWRAEWRKIQRESTTCAHPTSGYGIENPVSRYLATMGALPVDWTFALPAIPAGGKLAPCGAALPHVIQQCASCKALARVRIERDGFKSTGAWDCGCRVQGLGSVRVGVDGSVTAEYVTPCAKHAGALHGPVESEARQ